MNGPYALALRTLQAEWVQGTCLVQEAGWWRPTTLHSYEGLLVLVEGENRKFLDHVALRADGLEPDGYVADPLSFEHRFRLPAGVVSLRSSLIPHEGAHGAVLELELMADAANAAPVNLQLRPVLDLRHMYDASAPEAIQLASSEGRALWAEHGAVLRIQPPEDATFDPGPAPVRLFHAMGSGFREQGAQGVRFTAERTAGLAPGHWEIVLTPGSRRVWRFGAGATRDEARERLAEARQHGGARLAHRAERYGQVRAAVGDRPGLAERVWIMLEGFGMRVGGVRVPEAGGWWFRTPWFRDCFEGLLGNWRTLRALGETERITDVVALALELQDPCSGRLPNRLPERKEAWRSGGLDSSYYHAIDATTLSFTLLDELEGEVPLEGLEERAKAAFRRSLAAFRSADPLALEGGAVLDDEGLLRAVPWHTWTDGKRKVGPVADLPLRVPRAWQEAWLMEGRSPREVWELHHQPRAYLPEVNAQWIRMLRWGSRHLPPEEGISELLERAQGAFRRKFDREDRLANLIWGDGRVDPTMGSPAIVALALLLPTPVFDRADRRRLWEGMRSRLLVEDDGRPFGLLVKDSLERVYLGDETYHEAVIWPRDTCYLLRLLEDLDEGPLYGALLVAQLAHQQHAGVLFYNHELFSLPDVRADGSAPHHLVPVKNPMQWWSQWCDPYWQAPAGPGMER